jgi:hypothetical protein
MDCKHIDPEGNISEEQSNPQAPQLYKLVVISTHCPEHNVWPAGHDVTKEGVDSFFFNDSTANASTPKPNKTTVRTNNILSFVYSKTLVKIVFILLIIYYL